MTALQKLISTIAGGTNCVQEAGFGPFVFPDVKGAKPFSARTAREGERLGLLELAWTDTNGKGRCQWCWVLTEKGRNAAANAALSRADVNPQPNKNSDSASA